MRRFDCYLFWQLTRAILAVILVITGIDLLFAMLGELDGLSDNYRWFEALNFVLLTSPRRLYEVMPFCLLIGVLIALGALARQSELVVMRSAGISAWRIAWSACRPALLFIVVGTLLGELVAPATEQIAQNRRAIQSGADQGRGGQGTWLRDNHDFIHFNAITAQGDLLGLTRYQFDENRQLNRISYAERARNVGIAWRLEQVITTRLTTARSESEMVDHQEWRSAFTPELLKVLTLKPDRLSVSELYRYASHLDQQQLESTSYWLAFWKRLFQPLATLALVLIGISFIFGPLRELAMETRVFAGISVGIAFYFAQNILAPASIVFHFSPVWAAALPPALCLALALRWLMRAA